ncbi:unnamed protein product, partial [Thlaspi arvense]
AQPNKSLDKDRRRAHLYTNLTCSQSLSDHLDETMRDSNETTDPSPPMVFHKDAKTRVFWDVDDYPIPEGLEPASVYQSMKEAIEKQLGCHGEVTIHAYADKNATTFSEAEFKDAGFEFEVLTEVGKNSRFWCMYADIKLWQLENPSPANMIILAKIVEEHHMPYCIKALTRMNFPGGSSASLLTSTILKSKAIFHPSPPLLKFHKDAKTRVFWDVDEIPIPKGQDPAWIYQSMKEAMEKQCFHGEVSILAYADKNTTTFSQGEFKDAGFEVEVIAEEGKHARFWCMYADIMMWVLQNPAPANVILLAKIIDKEIIEPNSLPYRIGRLSGRWGYGVLLSGPEQEWEWLFSGGGSASFLTSILES